MFTCIIHDVGLVMRVIFHAVAARMVYGRWGNGLILQTKSIHILYLQIQVSPEYTLAQFL